MTPFFFLFIETIGFTCFLSSSSVLEAFSSFSLQYVTIENKQSKAVYSTRIPFELLSDLGEDGPVFTHDALDNRGDWNVAVNNRNRKRQRISTGSQSNFVFTSKEDFKHLSMDDKLIAMFDEMGIMANKVDLCLQLHSRVNNIEAYIDDHSSRLTLLENKPIDLEARGRRNNLTFGGY